VLYLVSESPSIVDRRLSLTEKSLFVGVTFSAKEASFLFCHSLDGRSCRVLLRTSILSYYSVLRKYYRLDPF
jgi:hypothetical protein